MSYAILSRTFLAAGLFAILLGAPALAHEGKMVDQSIQYDSLDRTVIDVCIEDFSGNKVTINGTECLLYRIRW